MTGEHFHADEAIRLHEEEGCNCSASVLTAFCDVTGLDAETSKRVACSLGAGMGKLQQTCGAFSGMLLALGMVYGPATGEAKKAHYARVHELGERFLRQYGALDCPTLLAEFNSDDPALLPARKKHCGAFLRACCDYLDAFLAAHPV